MRRTLSTDPKDWLEAGNAVKRAVEALNEAGMAVQKVAPVKFADRLFSLARNLPSRSQLEGEMYKRPGKVAVEKAFTNPLNVFYGGRDAQLKGETAAETTDEQATA